MWSCRRWWSEGRRIEVAHELGQRVRLPIGNHVPGLLHHGQPPRGQQPRHLLRPLLRNHPAIAQHRLGEVRSEALATWVTGHYPRRRYPVIFVGSANGALVHLVAALDAAWLPQTLLLPSAAGASPRTIHAATWRPYARPAGHCSPPTRTSSCITCTIPTRTVS